eukprot:TRINITY_DN17812_c0_g1_i3.p1 TRINITY_DN17812_c0_g1~~TRINITY_DN17812_c0_g1_i3.p1  ORF type:complete len:516 (-),score=109.51 TRINITY_DN17812_c0_g1_i3:307-1806(-)
MEHIVQIPWRQVLWPLVSLDEKTLPKPLRKLKQKCRHFTTNGDGDSRLSVSALTALVPHGLSLEEQVERLADVDEATLAKRLLEAVVGKQHGSGGEQAAVAGNLVARLPSEPAVLEVLQLVSLDKEPYSSEIHRLLVHQGAIASLVTAALSGASCSSTKRRCALALCLLAAGRLRRQREAASAIEGHLKPCVEACQTVEFCDEVLLILLEGGLCPPALVVRTLGMLLEQDAEDLQLQSRVALALSRLAADGRLDASTQQGPDAHLLDERWATLVARFQGAEVEIEQLAGKYHAEVQQIFQEETARKFELDAAERCWQSLERGDDGMSRLKDVLSCFVEHVEDYETRLGARAYAWDADSNSLVHMEKAGQRLKDEVRQKMEPGLFSALRAAAALGPRTPLRRKTKRLKSDCQALLEMRTEATEAHEDQTEKLRRESVFLDILVYLEALGSGVQRLHLQIARHMLGVLESSSSKDQVVLERLAVRLRRLDERYELGKTPAA